MTSILALAGGSWIFLGVIVVAFIGVVIGYYTRKGLGIAAHPTDGRGAAPGAEGPGRISTAGDDSEPKISERGTR